jgi:hypothetical protein
MTAIESAKHRLTPPPPLTTWKENKARFVKYVLFMTVLCVALGYAGYLLAYKGYDIGFENPVIKPIWDGLLSWQYWPLARHLIRDAVFEGIMIHVMVMFVKFNEFKWAKKGKNPSRLDRIVLKEVRIGSRRVRPINLFVSTPHQPQDLTRLQAISWPIVTLLFMAIPVIALVGVFVGITIGAPAVAKALGIQALAGHVTVTHSPWAALRRHLTVVAVWQAVVAYAHQLWVSKFVVKATSFIVGGFFTIYPSRMVYIGAAECVAKKLVDWRMLRLIRHRLHFLVPEYLDALANWIEFSRRPEFKAMGMPRSPRLWNKTMPDYGKIIKERLALAA